MKIVHAMNVLIALVVLLVFWEVRRTRTSAIDVAQVQALSQAVGELSVQQTRLQSAQQAILNLLTAASRETTREPLPEATEKESRAATAELRELHAQLERLQQAVEARPGPTWTRDLYPEVPWHTLETRPPRIVPYDEFRGLRPGTPYATVVSRLGLPQRMVGSLANTLYLLYPDPESAEEFVQVEIGGGILVGISGVPKQ